MYRSSRFKILQRLLGTILNSNAFRFTEKMYLFCLELCFAVELRDYNIF